jgi:hypothetical protein
MILYIPKVSTVAPSSTMKIIKAQMPLFLVLLHLQGK